MRPKARQFAARHPVLDRAPRPAKAGKCAKRIARDRPVHTVLSTLSFSNRDGKGKRKVIDLASLSSFQSFLWFDRAAGFPSPRPQYADADAHRSCQGWPLFAATEGLAFTWPSTTARWFDRGVLLFYFLAACTCSIGDAARDHGSLRSRLNAAATSGSKRRAARSTTNSHERAAQRHPPQSSAPSPRRASQRADVRRGL